MEIRGTAVVAVDGADAADPVAFAEQISHLLRGSGRGGGVVSLHDFVRPASVRLEYGHHDELSYRTLWFDYQAVDREIVRALRERGTWLSALWDEQADRSARAPVTSAGAQDVVFVAGPMLLGRGLDFDVSVHLQTSERTVRRLTPKEQLWTVSPLIDHQRETTDNPTFLVRWDHPERPAVARVIP